MSERRETLLSERLRDERGRRVVFVSHCLLNENTRYLGGAFHSGAVPEIAELQRLGIGIHQMRCGAGSPFRLPSTTWWRRCAARRRPACRP